MSHRYTDHRYAELSREADAELLACARTGDQRAYAELWRRYEHVARAVARTYWWSADPDDLVALHPLTAPWFPVDGIDDYGKVDNPTSNQHGISGYLSDARVAATILEALEG